MKKLMLMVALGFAVVGLSACTNTEDTGREQDNDSELMEYTLTELAMYDGQDGNDAYIAVDGYVYDVTDDPNWDGGRHEGYMAGQDLTTEIGSSSPHGASVLGDVPKIGIIVEDEEENPTDNTMYLTITELSMYDGQDGNDAYIAIDGIVYDVTDNSNWSGGMHQGISAGNDITVEIGSAPHGESVLTGLLEIGELVVDNTGDGPYDPYLYLTITELADYDGSGDMDAYIAVDDVIYDVTNDSNWSGGDHEGYDAGQDLTDEIMSSSPHGTGVLNGIPVVGEIVPE